MFFRSSRDNDPLVHEVDHAFSDMGSTTPSSSEFDYDMETVLGILPTKGTAADSKVLLTRLTQFHHKLPARPAFSGRDQRDGILKAWASLLHLYLVSDTVAFTLIGLGSRQLVCSHWSQDSTYNLDPQLTFIPFEEDKHHTKVNTAVTFTDIENGEGEFSYIVCASEKSSCDLRLYTQPTIVPRKFASTVWDTFLEIHSDVLDSGSHKWHQKSISSTDTRVLQSFLPGPPAHSRITIHDLWRESARTAPLLTAVEAWDGVLSYAKLDELAESLARRLVSSGVQRGDFIPFSFEKGLWMVVAVLAIVKAGAAFVAIDPSQPTARAQEIIDRLRAKIVLASPSQSTIYSNMGKTVLTVSADTTTTDHEQDSYGAPLPRVKAEDTAVCIFTSGSTGKPKGIVVQHQALATRMLAEGGTLGFRGARCLQFAASTWDIFITDIFATLAHQGCVCIPSEEDRLFNLAEFCTSHNVTHAIITPTLANMLTPASFPTLKTLVFSGEALRADVVARWSPQKDISLYQGYGPAETGGCIIGPIAQRAETIGYTLKNYICVLVDPQNHDRLVPVGAVGELLVAGPGLLREYIHDPSKTRAAIVENPTWCNILDLEETRFYKTGDLLRYNIDTLDGSLEFVGRTDGQVKFHGQRIEVGEVEHHIGQFPNVANCMVTLVKEGTLKDNLVAIVEVDGQSGRLSNTTLALQTNMKRTREEIHRFLLSCLPRFMVPSKILLVSNMPFNASMKLDRAAINKWVLDLPAEQATAGRRASLDAGSTKLSRHEATARTVARMYATIVSEGHAHKRRRFEDQDFNLQEGGIDSVQIMTLSQSIKQKFGVQIPIDDMLSSRASIRSIASIIAPDESRQSPQPHVQDVKGAETDIDDLLQSVFLSSEKIYHNSAVRNVFLTGSSGYLGIEILHQLLTRSTCHVYTLLRGTSQNTARDDLIKKAVAAKWWKGEYASRLEVWLGDLSAPQLGLDSVQWGMLQGQGRQTVDSIIHNGAKVHYHKDYESLKLTNVSSTLQLLKATNSRHKPLHSFVFISGGQPLSFDDKDDTAIMQDALQGSGYARSKATSELVVKRFAEQAETKAKHVRVIKPGFIIGDAKQGIASQNDFIWRYIATSAEVGVYDRDNANGWLFVTDISRVSENILQGVFDHGSKPVIKVLDGIQFEDLWQLLQDELGYSIRPVSQQDWLSKLRQSVAAKKEKHVMFPLMHMFEGGTRPIGVSNGPRRASIGVKEALLANVRELIRTEFLMMPGPLPTPPFTSKGDLRFSRDREEQTADKGMKFSDAFDVQSVRKHFPALDKGLVAFNNAAGTAVYQGAIDGAQRYMSAFPTEIGLDDAESKKKTEGLMAKAATLAAFMNAEADEIAFGSSTTTLFRILGQAIKGSMNSDCEIIVSNLCHEASAASWLALAKDVGVTIKWWAPPPGDDPCLSLETLKPLLSPRTRVVACNHVSNVVGTIHPIREVADLVHTIPGAIVIVDGVAYAPHRPVDVKALDVDFYCFSWYKVFGPHIAQLYGRRSVQKRILPGIGHFFFADYPGLEWRLRLGAPTFELEAGLVSITRYLSEIGWDKMIAQETVLQEVLLSYLRELPGVFRVFGEKSSDSKKRVPVITFQVIGESSREVMNAINQQGKFRIVAGHCWAPRPTHDVLKLEQDGLIRVSFVHYNTVQEVQEFCEALDSVVTSLQRK